MPHILITGAAGFVGQITARRLLELRPDVQLTLVDVVAPPAPSQNPNHAARVRSVEADLARDDSVVDGSVHAVLVFHGIMSAGAEADFELGLRANVDATRALLEAIRKRAAGARVVYASSLAVYGRPAPAVVHERVVPTPESSYGTQKLIIEALINDYSRRKFIDGVSLRFPTVSIRPGKPTQAASSFLSGIIREPLAGKPSVVPVLDRQFRAWLTSPDVLVQNIVHALFTLNTDALPAHIRQVNLPGFTVSVQQMLDALQAVGGQQAADLVSETEDLSIKEILYSWAQEYDNSYPLTLGFTVDESFDKVVRDYYNAHVLPTKN
ncbi:hypothetical protein V1514DRAFT_218499 [Lipomyces japonicus]|uniref:uncharacterized protein n=1 Tax=Lipomyces japonicus TaxID=56871 RepID=UPI0034CE2B11